MDSWVLKQLRFFILVELNDHIPSGHFDQNLETLNFHKSLRSHEYLSYESKWGYLATQIGRQLYFQAPENFTARKISASEILMNLGMLASAKSALNAYEQLRDKAAEANLPDGNSGSVADKIKSEAIPILQNNIKSGLRQYLTHLSPEEARPYISLIEESDESPAHKKNDHIQLEDIVEIKPNFMGIGININALWRRITKQTDQN